ncbi:MAG: ArsI/CadI family heavy metal resistance metalloenzyme [Bacteriovorax sp.]|nr:ArsI/CadI family heavy metal resistance metalloenzyme [Bacteriovorax sp.]
MRTHLSINVKNVEESVEFYERVFGVKPQKFTDHYAKFDLKNPSLNFTMQTANETEGRSLSRVNHLGIEVDSADAVAAWEDLLTERGVVAKPEMNTECCYARQDKVWFQDPDGNSWEIFYVHEQLPIVNEKQSMCVPSMNALGKKCC